MEDKKLAAKLAPLRQGLRQAQEALERLESPQGPQHRLDPSREASEGESGAKDSQQTSRDPAEADLKTRLNALADGWAAHAADSKDMQNTARREGNRHDEGVYFGWWAAAERFRRQLEDLIRQASEASGGGIRKG